MASSSDLRPVTDAAAAVMRRLRGGLLLVGFCLAVAVRFLIGGPGPGRSVPAAAVFAALLLCLTATSGTRIVLSVRAVAAGLAGTAVLCLPIVVLRQGAPLHDATGFASWAVAVSVVAVAEELFLRGALYDVVRSGWDERAAIIVAAIAFAGLHVPLYGWHVVPLDLTVGLVLGELRRVSGTATAPAITHVLADLAAWFLR